MPSELEAGSADGTQRLTSQTQEGAERCSESARIVLRDLDSVFEGIISQARRVVRESRIENSSKTSQGEVEDLKQTGGSGHTATDVTSELPIDHLQALA